MDILFLLDRLETVLTSGSRIPLTGKTMVDEHECLDIVDQLRVAIPDEIKQAKRVISDRERLLDEAEEQAKRMFVHAQEQAALMATQHEISRAAENRARKIMESVEAEAVERKEASDRYIAESLGDLETRLTDLLGVVRNGLRALDKDGRKAAPRDEVREPPPRLK